MLRFAHDTHVPSPLVLLYSARTPEELVFRSELDAIVRSSSRITVQYSITRPGEAVAPWNGRVGRLDAEWIRSAAERLDRPRYYIAGLPEMVAGTAQLLGQRLGIAEDDIEYEMFRGF
jgi:ferredoxin-NADP reductase